MVLAAWYLAIVMKCAVTVRLVSDRLVMRYPVFAIFMLANTARSLILAYFQRTDFASPYREIWAASLPLMLVLEALAVAEAIWLIVRAFPGFERIAPAVYGTFAFVGMCGAIAVANVPGWRWLPMTAVKIGAMLLGCLIAGTFFFFSQRGLTMSRNLRTHAGLLAGCLIAEMTSHTVHQASAGWNVWIQVSPSIIWAVYCGCWARLMRAAGESAPEAARVPAVEQLEGNMLTLVNRAERLFEDIR